MSVVSLQVPCIINLVKTMMILSNCNSILIVLILTHRPTIAVFPIDTVRLSFLFPSTPAVETPEIAWFVLGLALKIFAVGVYLGLPREPPRRPIRENSDFLQSNLQFSTSSSFNVAFYLDVSNNVFSLIWVYFYCNLIYVYLLLGV